MANRPKSDNDNDKKEGAGAGATPDTPNPTPSGSRPPYLEAALRISSSRPLGASHTDTSFIVNGSDSVNISTGSPGSTGTPGICAYDYISTYGVSTGNTSALNRAVFNDFNLIRSKISGNRSYEPCDHMIYRIAIDSLRELYIYVRRIYGIIRRYSATNLYKPRAILEAMGLDADSWIRNAAALYQWLLTTQESLKPFPTIPVGDMSVNHVMYDTYLFTDGDIECTQTYIMNHRYYYSYEVVDKVKGLTIREMADTYDEFLIMWDQMYQALQNSADVYVIAADIRRAFEDKVITELPSTPVDYSVEYHKYDPVLESVRNACVLGLNNANDYMDALTQLFRVEDNGFGGLTSAGLAQVLNFNIAASKVTTLPMMLNHINCIEQVPTPDSILNSVRLKPAMEVKLLDVTDDLISVGLQIRAMGTEVIVSARMVGVDASGAYSRQSAPTGYAMFMTSSMGEFYPMNALTNVLRTLSYIANFDWHHPVVVWGIDTQDPSELTKTFYTYEDVQNYIPVTNSDLKMIHEAKLLADFGF